MAFLPVARVAPYETLGYAELRERLALARIGPVAKMTDEIGFDTDAGEAWSRAIGEVDLLIRTALCGGDLKAYVRAAGDADFHMVPANHWSMADGLEGSPSETLFCWNLSPVPARFHDVTLLFFKDEVTRWEAGLPLPVSASGPAKLGDWLSGDYVCFAACEAEGASLVGGFWSVFVTGAWIASRSESFTAAVQVYERRQCVGRGGLHDASAWLVLGNIMGERFNLTLTQTLDVLRAAIGDRAIDAGSGFDSRTDCERIVSYHEWKAMAVVHDMAGTSLVPGVYNLAWPSVDVRFAFPALVTHNQPVAPDCERGRLPPNAKPNDRAHEEAAHEAAHLVRSQGLSLEQAARKVAPQDNTRAESSIIRAIRQAFDLMYDRNGRAIKN